MCVREIELASYVFVNAIPDETDIKENKEENSTTDHVKWQQNIAK